MAKTTITTFSKDETQSRQGSDEVDSCWDYQPSAENLVATLRAIADEIEAEDECKYPGDAVVIIGRRKDVLPNTTINTGAAK